MLPLGPALAFKGQVKHRVLRGFRARLLPPVGRAAVPPPLRHEYTMLYPSILPRLDF